MGVLSRSLFSRLIVIHSVDRAYYYFPLQLDCVLGFTRSSIALLVQSLDLFVPLIALRIRKLKTYRCANPLRTRHGDFAGVIGDDSLHNRHA